LDIAPLTKPSLNWVVTRSGTHWSGMNWHCTHSDAGTMIVQGTNRTRDAISKNFHSVTHRLGIHLPCSHHIFQQIDSISSNYCFEIPIFK
jgi:hypothetical protein